MTYPYNAYAYSSRHKLKELDSVTSGSTQSVVETYQNDGLERRWQKAAGTGSAWSQFYYDLDGRVLQEYQNNGAVVNGCPAYDVINHVYLGSGAQELGRVARSFQSSGGCLASSYSFVDKDILYVHEDYRHTVFDIESKVAAASVWSGEIDPHGSMIHEGLPGPDGKIGTVDDLPFTVPNTFTLHEAIRNAEGGTVGSGMGEYLPGDGVTMSPLWHVSDPSGSSMYGSNGSVSEGQGVWGAPGRGHNGKNSEGPGAGHSWGAGIWSSLQGLTAQGNGASPGAGFGQPGNVVWSAARGGGACGSSNTPSIPGESWSGANGGRNTVMSSPGYVSPMSLRADGTSGSLWDKIKELFSSSGNKGDGGTANDAGALKCADGQDPIFEVSGGSSRDGPYCTDGSTPGTPKSGNEPSPAGDDERGSGVYYIAGFIRVLNYHEPQPKGVDPFDPSNSSGGVASSVLFHRVDEPGDGIPCADGAFRTPTRVYIDYR